MVQLEPGSLLFRDHSRWLQFDDPLVSLQADRPSEIAAVLGEVETHLASGHWVVGYLAYEAAPAFDLSLATCAPSMRLPLAWFAAYRRANRLANLPARRPAGWKVGPWEPSMDGDLHRQRVERIRSLIAQGDNYQVNLTFALETRFEGDPWNFFHQLWMGQPAPYSAYLDLGRFTVCSVSPELFFRRHHKRLVCRPMKGTAPRGRWSEEDFEVAYQLQHSPKQRAENVMIVDMVRNDLGRVANPGTVEVERLCEVERYPSVHQLTSTVTATTTASLTDTLGALFPSASITGAPKHRAMQRIVELEQRPRGLYTGTLGWARGQDQACFNVGIRTAVVDRERRSVHYGTGGGIVWDSTPETEYTECRWKAQIAVNRRQPEFSLFETLLWTPTEGFFLLARHRLRLASSARHFGFPWEPRGWQSALEEAVADLAAPARVKVTLAPDGTWSTETGPLAVPPHLSSPTSGIASTCCVRLAARPVDSADPFLFHKTTSREAYDQPLRGADELIYSNERGELTESTVSNIVLGLGPELLTPQRECGLLAGTFRAALLDRGEIRETVLPRQTLGTADAIYLVNSVRGWRHADLLPDSPAAQGDETSAGTGA